jgi:hypothetical protein
MFLPTFKLRLDEKKLLPALPDKLRRRALKNSRMEQLKINMKFREEFDVNSYSISVQQFMNVI